MGFAVWDIECSIVLDKGYFKHLVILVRSVTVLSYIHIKQSSLWLHAPTSTLKLVEGYLNLRANVASILSVKTYTVPLANPNLLLLCNKICNGLIRLMTLQQFDIAEITVK